MLDFIKNLTKSNDDKKEIIMELFFALPQHKWINDDRYLKRGFKFLIDSLNEEGVQFFYQNRNNLFFIQGNASLGSALGAESKTHIILVFPNLVRMLLSAVPLMGVSVLAHEVGHLIKGHSFKTIDPLVAQCEADQFAFDIGFGHELQEVLMDQPVTIETRTRIARLTSKILSQG